MEGNNFALIVQKVKAGAISVAEEAPGMIAFLDKQDEVAALNEYKARAAALIEYLAHRKDESVAEHNAAGKVMAKVKHRLGEVLAATVNHRGGRPKKRGHCDRVIPGELGGKNGRQNTSKRTQKTASIPWDDIAAAFDAATERNERTSLSRIEKRHAEEQDEKEPVPFTAPGDAELWEVVAADCLGWFANRPADSLDLIFGSPPYEQARLYLEGGHDRGIARGTEAWTSWMVDVYRAALRCCRGLVAFVVQGQTKDYSWSAAPALLMADLSRQGITLRCPPLYKRVGIPGSGGPDWLRNDYEFVICATRGGPLPWSDNTAMGHEPRYGAGGSPSHRRQDGSRVNDPVAYATPEERGNVGPHRARRQKGRVYRPPERSNPGNVVNCGAVGGGNMGDRICHKNEAPFPEHLAEFFIRSFCPPGGLVADPFSGSGTTGAMAVRLGRRFRGCDIRESQVRLSRRRLSNITPPVLLEG
jgi:hypothetical protein